MALGLPNGSYYSVSVRACVWLWLVREYLVILLTNRNPPPSPLPTNIQHHWIAHTHAGSSGSSSINPQPALSRAAVIQNEVDQYLALALPAPTDATLHEWQPVADFWKDQERLGRLPILCQLAKKVLGAPATSVYSERLFSEMGNLYEKKRSCLRPDVAENLLFLHHNLAKMSDNAPDKLQQLRDRDAEEQAADSFDV